MRILVLTNIKPGYEAAKDDATRIEGVACGIPPRSEERPRSERFIERLRILMINLYDHEHLVPLCGLLLGDRREDLPIVLQIEFSFAGTAIFVYAGDVRMRVVVLRVIWSICCDASQS